VPPAPKTHPLDCHRWRRCDRDCVEVMLVWLVIGCSWGDAERLCGNKASDTTVRARRDQWIAGGVFDAVFDEALCTYDTIVGLTLDEVAIDGSQHNAPTGAQGTGPNCTDEGRSG
jgi:hypothetical protein